MTRARFFHLLLGAGLVLFAAATPFSIALSQSALGLAAVGLAGKLVTTRGGWPGRTPMDLPILGYAAAEFLAASTSVDHIRALVYSKRLLLLSVIYLVAAYVRSTRAIGILLGPLFVVCTLLSAGSLVRYFHSAGGLEERIQFTQIYMTTAGILTITTCLALGILLWVSPGAHRWWLGVAVGIMALCLVFTYTRSAWLGLIAGAAVLAGLRGRWWSVLLTVAVPLLLLAVASPALRDRALSSFAPTHFRNVERVHMWASGLRIWRDYPFTGVGDIGTAELSREYMSPEAREVAGHFHSNLIHLLVTLGAVGIAAVGWLFWRILLLEVNLCRGLRRKRGLLPGVAAGSLASLVAFHTAGLFEWNLGDAEVVTLLWFTVGLAMATTKLRPEATPGDGS